MKHNLDCDVIGDRNGIPFDVSFSYNSIEQPKIDFIEILDNNIIKEKNEPKKVLLKLFKELILANKNSISCKEN